MARIKLRDIDEKLDSNRVNILEQIDKVYGYSQIIKDNIDISKNYAIKEINDLKEVDLTLERKIDNLDNKLNYIIESIQNLGSQLDKIIKDLNKDISEKINKESQERKDSLKEIKLELSNLNELTKIMIVNDMASILEEA
ncbi:hypothetical protein [Romboutsia ilealis]|uniref:hypothetical protein n=1 Tax=Romboutsia ilealis TaxID=1115758 RepID=UPI002494F51A|nr:hypothetical protein [Romboutsia ilealis]